MPTAALAMSATHDRLLARANEQRDQYPQYVGYFDAWVVATATRPIVQRGQQALAKGEQCLLDPTSFESIDGVQYVTVLLTEYLSNGAVCMRRASDFTVAG